MDFDFLKISNRQIAQSEATIPIRAIRLFPENKLEKLSWVILKIAKAQAKTISMFIRILIFIYLNESIKLQRIFYIKSPLTLEANNLTAIAKRITPKTFRITPSPPFPRILSIFPDDFRTI